nr:ABC transporter permease [Methylomarinum sp. Ch1-1]MDP4523000.1 ABC transporter permease [Methylomarinum sp. Ch1-1]
MSARYLRLTGLIRKEFLQIRRDPSSLAIAFVMPVFLLLLFGYGVSLDARNVPIGLVVEKISPATRSFTSGFEASDYFNATYFADIKQARLALQTRKINAIIRIRPDFDRQLHGRRAPASIQLILDGVDANTARLVSGYVQGVWNNWLTQYAEQHGQQASLPVWVEQRIWYNSALRSRSFWCQG